MRAHVEFLANLVFSQRFQHKTFKSNMLFNKRSSNVHRARSCGIIRKQILRTPAATPASVHLTERAWPLGATKMSACVVSPALVITVAVFLRPATVAAERRASKHLLARAF